MIKISFGKVICVSLALYFVGFAAVKYYLADINMLNITPEQSETLWQLGIARDIGFWGFCFFAVVSSIYNFLCTRKKTYLIYVVLAICGNIAFIGFTLDYSNELADTPPMTGLLLQRDDDFLAKYRKLLSSDQKDLEQRSKMTKRLASTFFQDSGVIVEVIEESGEVVTYVPSPEDYEMRQLMLQAEALIKYEAEALKSAGTSQVLLLLSAIVIGLLSVWLKNKHKYN